MLAKNLIGKWKRVQSSEEAGTVDYEGTSRKYRLLPGRNAAQLRLRLLTIKEGSRVETKIRSWYGFEFELSGLRDFLEMAVLVGVGLLEVVESKTTSGGTDSAFLS